MIKDDDNESIYYTPRSEFDDKDKKQQTNNIDTKPLNVFNYLKRLSQLANNVIDKIEGADDDINNDELLFIGSNKEKFNLNIFDMPLNFLLNIYNTKLSLKEAEFEQKEIKRKREDLRGYRNNAEKEQKEEINAVLRQANDLLVYRAIIINAFKDETFPSKHLKKSDNAAYSYVLKDVNKFIEKIKLMEEKFNLGLFEEFF